jgi:hypothetical protein
MSLPYVLELRISDKPGAEHSEEPTDPLGELSPLELGLLRFFFHNNQEVEVTVGGATFLGDMDPDIAEIVHHIPGIIRDLLSDRPTEIAFAEVHRIIKLFPAGDRVRAAIVNYSNHDEDAEYLLSGTQVVGELDSLIREVMTSAVAQGFVTADEAQRFLEGKG